MDDAILGAGALLGPTYAEYGVKYQQEQSV